MQQYPGLTLMHTPCPPPALPTKPEMQYFLIDRASPFWGDIVQTRRLGIYVPEEIANPVLELSVVLE
jgi:type VI secretion system protein ImpJ